MRKKLVVPWKSLVVACRRPAVLTGWQITIAAKQGRWPGTTPKERPRATIRLGERGLAQRGRCRRAWRRAAVTTTR